MSEHAVSKSYCVEMAGFLLIFVCVGERRGDFVFIYCGCTCVGGGDFFVFINIAER